MAGNQRHYYRILDTVAVEYRVVPADAHGDSSQGKRAEDFLELTATFALLSALNAIDNEQAAFARILHERDRELAGFLRGINRKIELIAHAIAMGAPENLPQHRYEASLSEGGIAFDCTESFAAGTLLAVKLTLFPRFTSIVSFARVVTSDNGNTRPFSLSLEFVDLDDNQRQLLARHVLRIQSAQQRSRRET